MSSAARPQALHWCFTENNPEGELDVIMAELYAEGHIQYAVWQHEVGANANVTVISDDNSEVTTHFQGI